VNYVTFLKNRVILAVTNTGIFASEALNKYLTPKNRSPKMKTNELNLFIVEDNLQAGIALEGYLKKRFGKCIRISTFINGEQCLDEVDSNTHLVILNHSLESTTGLEVLKSIKEINTNTEVIMMSDKEDIALAIESFQAGANNSVVKGTGSRKKVSVLVKKILMAPIRIIVIELGLSQRLAMFLMAFITVGIVVSCGLYIMNH
jgi:PleD family two-component response regulator